MQPIFHAGELQAKKQRSARQSLHTSAAAQAYQRAVLESLQQVVDSLRVLEADALVLQARSTALDQSNASYIIARQRFEVGGISEVSLLEARRQNLQTALDHSRARTQRFADTAALLQSVAGTF